MTNATRDAITENIENYFLLSGNTQSKYNIFYTDGNINIGYGINLTAAAKTIDSSGNTLAQDLLTSINITYTPTQWTAVIADFQANTEFALTDLNTNYATTITQAQATALLDKFYNSPTVGVALLTQRLLNRSITLAGLPDGMQDALEDLQYQGNQFLTSTLSADLMSAKYASAAYDIAFVAPSKPDGGAYEDRTIADAMRSLGLDVTLNGNHYITALGGSPNIPNLIMFLQKMADNPAVVAPFLVSPPGINMYTQLKNFEVRNGFYVVVQPSTDTWSQIASIVGTANNVLIDGPTLQRLNSVFSDTKSFAAGGLIHVPTSVTAIGTTPVVLPTLLSGQTFVFDPTTNGLYAVGASVDGSNANEVFVVGSSEALSTSLIATISATSTAVTFGLDPLSGYAPTLSVNYNGGLATINGGLTHSSLTNINVTGGFLSDISTTDAGSFEFRTSLQLSGLPLAILSNSDGSCSFGIDPPNVFTPVVNFAPNGLQGDIVSTSINNGVALFDTQIGAGATAEVGTSFSVISTQTAYTFSSNSGILKLDDPASFNGTVYGAVTGDFVELPAGQGWAQITQFGSRTNPTFQIKNTLTGSNATIRFAPSDDYSTASFALGNLLQDGGLSIEILRTSTACYLSGTRIVVELGEIPVEALSIGDRVRTYAGDLRPIRWIGRRSYAERFARSNPAVCPVRFGPGSLGEGLPHSDLWVSPEHAMYLDGVLVPAKLLVNGTTITWARDIDPIHYFHVELDRHDILIANGAPAESFVDCDSRGMFQNEAEFAALYPHDVGPRWTFCAPRIEEGHRLESIRAMLNARAGIKTIGSDAHSGPLVGYFDEFSCLGVAGWAWQSAHPDQAVRLEIVVDGGVVAEVVANRARPDVREAGYGNGQCGFELTFAHPLSPFIPHEIRVRRASDGIELTHSPRLLEAAPVLDTAGHRVLASAIDGAASAKPSIEELDQLLNVLVTGTGKLLRTRARLNGDDLIKAAGQRKRRVKSLTSLVSGSDVAGGALALFVDDRMPTPDHDAGSAAVLDHMRSLVRLGFRVGFAPRDMKAKRTAAKALETAGILCLAAPYYASIEQVLRQHQSDIEVVYLHRVSNASLYGELVRQLCPRARLIYSVADLHFLRLGREAALHDNPPVQSRKLREKELAAARLADAVVTHSSHEAALLRQMLPGLNVHTVPWSFRARPSQTPFAKRHGLAFVGGYDHLPNLDAAAFLTQVVMPRVWQQDPSIECLLVGDKMPERLLRLTGNRVVALGHVQDLTTVFDRVRLTVAPLRYGAGLKGKVLESLAAGVPCACTTVAVEGLALPASLSMIGAGDIDALVAMTLRLHGDETENARCAEAGLNLVRERFQPHQIDALMQAVVRPTREVLMALSA